MQYIDSLAAAENHISTDFYGSSRFSATISAEPCRKNPADPPICKCRKPGRSAKEIFKIENKSAKHKIHVLHKFLKCSSIFQLKIKRTFPMKHSDKF